MHSQERVKTTGPNSQDVVQMLTSHDQPLNDPESASASTSSHETGSQTEGASISSLESTIGSEGERSFIYGANDEDQYPFLPGHQASFLSGGVAGMIFQAFVYEYCRGRPEQNRGRRTDQHRNTIDRNPGYHVLLSSPAKEHPQSALPSSKRMLGTRRT
jgi:hypothetical protein